MKSLPANSGSEDFAATFRLGARRTGQGPRSERDGGGPDSHEDDRDLPEPGEFHKKLLALFGAQGTLSLERAIVKDLAIRLKWSLTS